MNRAGSGRRSSRHRLLSALFLMRAGPTPFRQQQAQAPARGSTLIPTPVRGTVLALRYIRFTREAGTRGTDRRQRCSYHEGGPSVIDAFVPALSRDRTTVPSYPAGALRLWPAGFRGCDCALLHHEWRLPAQEAGCPDDAPATSRLELYDPAGARSLAIGRFRASSLARRTGVARRPRRQAQPTAVWQPEGRERGCGASSMPTSRGLVYTLWASGQGFFRYTAAGRRAWRPSAPEVRRRSRAGPTRTRVAGAP